MTHLTTGPSTGASATTLVFPSYRRPPPALSDSVAGLKESGSPACRTIGLRRHPDGLATTVVVRGSSLPVVTEPPASPARNSNLSTLVETFRPQVVVRRSRLGYLLQGHFAESRRRARSGFASSYQCSPLGRKRAPLLRVRGACPRILVFLRLTTITMSPPRGQTSRGWVTCGGDV
jgi:hypothetical protein